MIILGLLKALGVGGSILAGAMLFMAAWYIRRVIRGGQRFGAAVADVGVHVMIVAIALGAVLLLGWASPRPTVILTDLHAGAETAYNVAVRPAVDMFANGSNVTLQELLQEVL